MKLFVLVCLWGVAYSETAVINEAVDKLLDESRAEIKRSGNDVLNIEDLRHPFSTRWHFIKINWLLHCTDGWLNSISTLRRTGDIVLSNDGPEISASFEMGLSDVEVYFKECRLSAKHLLSTTMQLWAKVKENQFSAKLSLSVDDERGQCNATLHNMQLTSLKGLTLKTGGGVINGFKDRMLVALIGHMKERFTRIISNHLNEIIRDYHLIDNLCDVVQDLNITSNIY